MLKKEIIEKLEKDFVENIHKMDDSKTQEDRVLYATLCCYIADLLADIRGTSSDSEHERLYNKYNLWKFE